MLSRFTPLLIATMLICSQAQAQYVWLDDKGVKQYSDQPPPVSVPASKILKSPNRSTSQAPAPVASQENGAETAKLQKPVTTASKNEEFNKRRAEQAEKEKKSGEEAKLAADKAKNCERARAYQQTLESGVRIAHTDKNGERNYITDEQRNQEMGEVKRALSACQ